MRLLDQISQAQGNIRVRHSDDASFAELPGVDAIRPQLAACPLRYVLSDEAARLCARIALEKDSIVGGCCDIVRAPSPSQWLEFDDSARHAILDTQDPNNITRQRMGLLAASGAGGRAGRLRICWENTAGMGPEAAPFVLEWDFDNPNLHADTDNAETFAVQLTGPGALNDLFARVRFRIEPRWADYYRSRTQSEAAFCDIVRQAIAPLCSDFLFLVAFFLLSMTGRALNMQPVERGQLNRARQRRGKRPLLNHIEVGIDLSREPALAHGQNGARSPARLHHVCGHLVRRGGAVFWRNAHMRGSAELGLIASRTVSLRVSAA